MKARKLPPALFLVAMTLLACTSTSESPPTYDLEIACADDVAAIYADPGALTAPKGTVLHCAKDNAIPKADLEARARAADGYAGPAFTSGAKVFRVLYRTERGNGRPGAGAALVFVPDTPRARSLPVIVASRGSRGQAAKCAPSLQDPAGDYVRSDFEHQVFPLVGAGYVVIAPDLAGYANFGATGNPPSGYADVPDVGRSTLDAARALKSMFKTTLADRVVLVGHSQGGATALGALATAESYGFEMDIAGVAVYAPLWLPGRTNQAILYSDPKVSEGAIPKVSLWYMYTKAELYDGPGQGALLFKPEVRDGIAKFVNDTCWSASYPDLEKLGTKLSDLYDAAFLKSVATIDACKDETCNKWLPRFRADRPTMTGKALNVPIVTFYGSKDTTLEPSYMACALKKLSEDGTKNRVCVGQDQTHASIVARNAAYVNDWIANLTLSGAAPAGCAESALNDENGQSVSCNILVTAVGE